MACAAGAMFLALAQGPIFAQEEAMWSQLPYMARGYGYSSETRLNSIVADEWVYQAGTPVAGIRWWGEYWRPAANPSYYSDSLGTAEAGGINHFTIKIWSVVPPGPDCSTCFPSPGYPMKTFELTNFNESLYGTTQKGRSVYSYYAPIPMDNWFKEAQSGTYFISIQASSTNTSKQWGWHESSDHSDIAAVQWFNNSGWYTLENNVYTNDMAFQIVQAPEPGGFIALWSGLVSLVGILIKRRNK